MVSCGSKIIKILLGVFNLLWLLLGAGVIFIGVKLYLWENDFNGAVHLADLNLKTASFAILAIGVVIALISFLGFCGACCENAFMLNAYGLLMILMIGAQVYALVYAIRNNSNIESEIGNGIKTAIQKINSNNDTAVILERFQEKLGCCGWSSPDDYLTNGTLPAATPYPGTCCKLPFVDGHRPQPCAKADLKLTEGCEHKLHFDEIQNLFKGTIGVGVAIIMFELILIFAACCLAREVRY